VQRLRQRLLRREATIKVNIPRFPVLSTDPRMVDGFLKPEDSASTILLIVFKRVLAVCIRVMSYVCVRGFLFVCAFWCLLVLFVYALWCLFLYASPELSPRNYLLHLLTYLPYELNSLLATLNPSRVKLAFDRECLHWQNQPCLAQPVFALDSPRNTTTLLSICIWLVEWFIGAH
jgi:hypothetical protein